jgi:hypothetical protein
MKKNKENKIKPFLTRLNIGEKWKLMKRRKLRKPIKK